MSPQFKTELSTSNAQGTSRNHLLLRATPPDSTRRMSAGSGRRLRLCLSGRAAAPPLEDKTTAPQVTPWPLSAKSPRRKTTVWLHLLLCLLYAPQTLVTEIVTQNTREFYNVAPQVRRAAAPLQSRRQTGNVRARGALTASACPAQLRPTHACCLGDWDDCPFHTWRGFCFRWLNDAVTMQVASHNPPISLRHIEKRKELSK